MVFEYRLWFFNVVGLDLLDCEFFVENYRVLGLWLSMIDEFVYLVVKIFVMLWIWFRVNIWFVVMFVYLIF